MAVRDKNRAQYGQIRHPSYVGVWTKYALIPDSLEPESHLAV